MYKRQNIDKQRFQICFRIINTTSCSAAIAILKWRSFSMCVSEAFLTVTSEWRVFSWRSRLFWSLNCHENKTVHKIANALLFLEKVGVYFFYLGKTLNRVVLRVFHGDLDFFLSPLKTPLTTKWRVLPTKKNNHPNFQKERCINS